jgi:peroxiredoxin
VIALGETAPRFELPDTAGRPVSFPVSGAVSVVVFTCNHCPYALAWHDRLLALARDFGRDGVRMVFVNPNDADRYPRDSIDAMRARVEAEGPWPAPYLHDEAQEVAREYDAKTTPDVFVFDAEGRLRYRGAPDSDHMDESQNAAWLRSAIEAALEDRDPDPAETTPVGCSIKWKQ